MTALCIFCNRIFANNYLMKRHQNNTKFCLKIQEEKKEKEKEKEKGEKKMKLEEKEKGKKIKFNCDHCSKIFSTKQNLNIHILKCTEFKFIQLDKKFNELQQHFELLKQKIDKQYTSIDLEIVNFTEKYIISEDFFNKIKKDTLFYNHTMENNQQLIYLEDDKQYEKYKQYKIKDKIILFIFNTWITIINLLRPFIV